MSYRIPLRNLTVNFMPPLLLCTRAVRCFHTRLSFNVPRSRFASSEQRLYPRNVPGRRTDDSRTTADHNHLRKETGSKPKSAFKTAAGAPSQAGFDPGYLYPPIHPDVGSKPFGLHTRDLTAISFSPFGFTLPILISRLWWKLTHRSRPRDYLSLRTLIR